MRPQKVKIAEQTKRIQNGALAAVLSAGPVLCPTEASASSPAQGTFASHDVFVDPDVCAPEGFPVDVVQDEKGAYQVFFDNSGAVTFIKVHIDYRAIISANGHTIVERDKWTDTYYPEGTARTVGTTVHISGEGPGLVQHGAGQIDYGDDGSVVAIHGPHPQFLGQTFCFAPSP
jgi:hypothetical protein